MSRLGRLTGNGHPLSVWKHLCFFVFATLTFFIVPLAYAQDVPTATAASNAPLGVVSGQVTNGSAASSIPVGLTVSLFVRDQNGTTIQKSDSLTQADGTYRMEGVPIAAEYEYVVAVEYRDRVFSSPFVNGDPASPALDLPVQIFELTEDPSVLTMSGSVAQVSVVGETLEVRQVFRFSNNSDRLFTTTTATEDGRFPSVLVTLPPGAQVVSFDNAARYIVSQRDFTVLDTAPVLPGDDHLIVLVYVLPYDGSPALIEQAVNYPLDGQVRLLVSDDMLLVNSEQLQTLGNETVGDKTYRAFGGVIQLQAGDVIRYELSGGGAATQSIGTVPAGSSILVILTGLIGLAMLGLAAALFMRRRKPAAANPDQIINALVQQIENLDKQHQAGQLAHDLWHRQRAALQARLDDLLGGEEGG